MKVTRLGMRDASFLRCRLFPKERTKSNGATLNPANLIDSSRFEVKTADATISVSPEHSYLVETRIIDGRKYLLIPADEDIEVNGFGVRVKGE